MQKTYRGGEPIYFGTPAELADTIPQMPDYGVWTDQQGSYALCRVWPCPSWKEITKHELFHAVNGTGGHHATR